MREKIVNEINQTIFSYISDPSLIQEEPVLQEMLYYALGFRNDGTLLESGKRLRPLFCCLTCGVLSGSHESALLYGAALEMLHNFTLIHDDIEDKSDTRHNRPTLWKRYGEALAINAGDLLFEIALSAAAASDTIINKFGLRRIMTMTEYLFLGQHRDISFENRTDITESEYLKMVEGKTAALLGCSFALGAIAGRADGKTTKAFQTAGQKIGIAFQIQDDYLGTWGEAGKLGKSVSSDIKDKKNTLAVVYTSANDPDFAQKWQSYDGCADRVQEFSSMMEKSGAPEYLQEQSKKYMDEAKNILLPYRTEGEYQLILDDIIDSLTGRNK